MTNIMTAMADFHFLRPWWLLALLLLPLLPWLISRRSKKAGQWTQVIAPALQPFLIAGTTRQIPFGKTAVVLATTIAIIALAGPTWERIALPIHKRESGMMVIFDLSPSMLAGDIKPDRLTRARLKTIDLLRAHHEGYVGLIAFAGDAHVVSPMTDDPNTIIAQLPALSPDLMPEAGSQPEAGIEKALELMMNAGMLEGDLLLVTDGMTRQARETIDALLRSFPDFRLSILGVGTDEGAPIPLGNSGFARSGRGDIVIARLLSPELQGLTQRHGGRYSTITNTEQDINYLMAPVLQVAVEQSRELERTLDTWDDKGQWLTLLLLPLAALAFRRGLVALVILTPLAYSPASDAGIWQDLWQTPNQQGYKAQQKEQYQEAQELFEDPMWKGTAAYNAGDFSTAEKQFGTLQTPEALYNLGNTLTQQGKLQEAIKAYDQALAANPDYADAARNRQIVEALLKQQQQQQQQQDQPGTESSQGNPSEAQSDQQASANESAGEQQTPANDHQSANEQAIPDQEEQSQQAGQEKETPAPGTAENQQQTQSTPEKAASQEASDKAAEEQQAQAAGEASTDDSQSQEQTLDQWLRRVPDDPGGLLRRKFEYQSRERYLNQQRRSATPPDQFNEERW